jgi:hypothetical protein
VLFECINIEITINCITIEPLNRKNRIIFHN